jgi:hypothetical protein
MRDSKLYRALTKLSGHELNRLHRLIISPYFNRNEAIINLFEWIKEDLQNPIVQPPTKVSLWHICYGEEEYNDGRFRKLQSDLLKLIEQYYAQQAYESNPIHQAKYLMETIIERDLESLQTSAIKTAGKLAEVQPYISASYYFFKYEIERNIYLLTRNETERSSKSNLENIVKNLDKFYLAEKLRYSSFILTHQHFAAVNYKMLFTDDIIEHVKNNDYSDVPPILIYYQILLSYKEPGNKNHYEVLKGYLKNYIHLFPEGEAREILDAVLNYGIIRMNAGEEIYVREVFDMYKQSLDNKLLLVKGQIDPFSFKNIVTAGLRLKEFDWVEEFINKYSQSLDDKFRENAVTFNYAQYYFYKKEYQKVIEQLSKVEYEDFTYSLNSKTLLMASYYELDEMEALNSFLDTFRLYIDRNKKLTQGKGKHYKNTIAIVRKLAKIVPGNIKEINKLEQEVLSAQGVVSKNWILEKLANLNKLSN